MADNRHKGSKKNHSSRNNPYSSRGLDKFSSVLAELGAKKEKIMETFGSQSVCMVRFMYSTSKDWIPLVIRRRDDNDPGSISKKAKVKKLQPPPPAKEAPGEGAPAMKAGRRWSPSYQMLVVMLLILLCIVMSGRMFAICCTSVWWYLVPKLKGDQSVYTKRTLRKKNDRRMVAGSG